MVDVAERARNSAGLIFGSNGLAGYYLSARSRVGRSVSAW